MDTRTLEALADSDISFTILAPHQCAAVCSPDGEWTPTPGGNGLDTARPYFTELPSGRRHPHRTGGQCGYTRRPCHLRAGARQHLLSLTAGP